MNPFHERANVEDVDPPPALAGMNPFLERANVEDVDPGLKKSYYRDNGYFNQSKN
jgi:hypothetical protein